MALNGADKEVVEAAAGDVEIVATWMTGPRHQKVAGIAAKLRALVEDGNAAELLEQTNAEAASKAREKHAEPKV